MNLFGVTNGKQNFNEKCAIQQGETNRIQAKTAAVKSAAVFTFHVFGGRHRCDLFKYPRKIVMIIKPD